MYKQRLLREIYWAYPGIGLEIQHSSAAYWGVFCVRKPVLSPPVFMLFSVTESGAGGHVSLAHRPASARPGDLKTNTGRRRW
ncbi:MAG: hypothetical protein OEX02_15740 [Cyclobacteriaceae bacterium]|nr:hypothetical protein [Cyclobacteriaceae bacterium]